jgi:ABC-2 type transport system ATP-binding protein
VLELTDLHKRYGDVIALDGASLRAERGRILGFLGPNGAGKTTAMRSVFGLVALDGGTARWDGATIDAPQRLRFGYMPEQRGLYPKMRVLDQLTFFGSIHGMTRHDAAASAGALLDELGLADRTDDRVENLSHGNQQRVQLAAALLHHPDLLVLDEPFSGLDPMGADRLAEIIRERATAGTAVVFSSHQLDLVEDVCQDVAVIDRGRVVLSGTLTDLRDASAWRRLDIGFREPCDWSPPDGARPLPTSDGVLRFLVPADADPAHLLTDAETSGKVGRFTFEPPSLSDLFREAVGR